MASVGGRGGDEDVETVVKDDLENVRGYQRFYPRRQLLKGLTPFPAARCGVSSLITSAFLIPPPSFASPARSPTARQVFQLLRRRIKIKAAEKD